MARINTNEEQAVQQPGRTEETYFHESRQYLHTVHDKKMKIPC